VGVEYAICRLSRNGRPLGLGFAVDRQHVVTCAHVVNKAHDGDESLPHRGLEQADFPDTGVTLEVEFAIGRYSVNDPEPMTSRTPLIGSLVPSGWLPSDPERFAANDVAVLTLSGPVPFFVPAVSARRPRSRDEVQVFGPAAGRMDGVHVAGEVLGEVGNGRIQVNVNGEGFRVRPGFSGGPVWLRDSGQVLGVLVACGRGDAAADAYLLDAQKIGQAWPAWADADPEGPLRAGETRDPHGERLNDAVRHRAKFANASLERVGAGEGFLTAAVLSSHRRLRAFVMRRRLILSGTLAAIATLVGVYLAVPHPFSPAGTLSPTTTYLASGGIESGFLSDPHGYQVRGLAFSPDGHSIVGSFFGGSYWEGSVTRAETDVWNYPVGHAQPKALLDPDYSGALDITQPYGQGLAFAPGNSNVLAIGASNGVDVWNLVAQSARQFSDPDSQAVVGLAYSSGGWIAEGDSMGNVYLLNAATGSPLKVRFRDYTVYTSKQAPSGSSTHSSIYSLNEVAIDSAGKRVAAVDSAGNVYVWSTSGGSPEVVSGASTTSVDAVAFSPNGKTLAISGSEGTLLWDVTTHSSRTLSAGPGTSPEAVAFSTDGKTLAVGDANGGIYLWNLVNFQASKPVASAVNSWGGLAFSPDGKTLAAYAASGNKVYLYKISYSKV
jgi:WD40 repeat protein